MNLKLKQFLNDQLAGYAQEHNLETREELTAAFDKMKIHWVKMAVSRGIA